jgi:signal transduction histidine kinase/ActR/RegA family two-component response regulator
MAASGVVGALAAAAITLAAPPGAARAGLALAAAATAAAAFALALRSGAQLRRRAARLAAREAALEMALDTVSTAIVALDREGRIEILNAAARDMLGLRAVRAAPAPWPAGAAFRAAEATADAPASPLAELASGRRVRGAEFLMRAPGVGGEIRVRATAEPAPWGAAIGAVLTLEDVTEQHRARVVSDRTDRLDALGKLTGGVAHDFNNLLSTILGAVQLAQRRSGDDPRIARHLDAALRATRTGAALVERLLGFAKRGSAQIEDVPLGELFAEAAPLAETVLEPGVALAIEPPPAELAARCDRAQLVTAILNLVSNARDAIAGAGGAGTIRISGGPAPERRDAVEITVADDGPGMSAEVMARALDPFFTTKDPAHGTGLGLSMVYGAIRRCGGDMRIETAPGAGATVRLRLPRARPTAVAAAAPPPALHGAGRAVLLVEDEADLLDTAEAMLSELGYAVIRATDARSALRELAGGRVIDALLTDVMMPGGPSGIELAAAARRARPSLPVIFVSGYVEREAEAIAGVGGALLRKPYSMEALAAALAEALPGPRRARKEAAAP